MKKLLALSLIHICGCALNGADIKTEKSFGREMIPVVSA